jgi:hypothetical protein
MSEVSRRRRSSRSRFDAAGHQGPAREPLWEFFLAASLVPGRVLTLPHWRETESNGCSDRICRSSQVVGCDVGYLHCLTGRKSGKLRRSDSPRAAAATKAARCASRMHTSPQIQPRPMSIVA